MTISEPLTIWSQDGRVPFGYENNIYVEYISLPILEYYISCYLNEERGVAIYASNPDIDVTKSNISLGARQNECRNGIPLKGLVKVGNPY